MDMGRRAHGKMQGMSIVRALSHLVTQGPSKPARSLVDRGLVERRRHHHVPTTWIDVDKAASATIVHLHGGGFLRGADQNTWEWLEDLRRRSGTAGAMVHYRVAPRYPFPHAFDDALQAVLSLTRNSVVRPGRWVLSGDGAGGGLALSVAQALREFGGGEPALLMLTTPWLDLSEERLRVPELREAADLYADGADRDDPRLNPLRGDMTGLPPVHLTTGGDDLLLADSTGLTEKLREAGVELEVHASLEGGHSFPLQQRSPAAQAARRSQITAVRRALDLGRELPGA